MKCILKSFAWNIGFSVSPYSYTKFKFTYVDALCAYKFRIVLPSWFIENLSLSNAFCHNACTL